MKIELKPNTAIVSVLESVDLYDLLFDKSKEQPKVMGLQNAAAQYNKVKILKLTEQTNDKAGKQVELKEGDIGIIAKSVISIVNEEANMKLGFVDTQNIIAKVSE